MSDGGHVCLDWYNDNGKGQPTVLFLPGITGMHACSSRHHSSADFCSLQNTIG